MSVVFLDTNALIKLYVPEQGANWLRNFVSNQQIAISELALFESATVLRRRYLEGTFSRAQALALLRRIRRSSINYQIIGLGGNTRLDSMVSIVFNLPTNLRIRALDGIQVEAALTIFTTANNLNPPEQFIFVSSDRQLLQVAQAQGLATENPEDHP